MNCSGWALPRVFGNFYRRDILYGNAGPTGIRGKPKPVREREEALSARGDGAGVDLPPSWFITQSALTANGFVFAGADVCYVLWTRIDHHLLASMSLEMSFLLSDSPPPLAPRIHPGLSPLSAPRSSIYEPPPRLSTRGHSISVPLRIFKKTTRLGLPVRTAKHFKPIEKLFGASTLLRVTLEQPSVFIEIKLSGTQLL